MSIDLGTVFKKALKDESKVLRPFFIPSPNPTKLVTEETYFRLRLSRMFLKNRRELFQTKYPVVNALMRFAGLDGKVEINYVAKPEMAGDGDPSRLDDIVTLDQTLLGPILYRGGDLELMLGLYAAPADDWAQRFISLAEGISQFVPNVALSTAVSVTATIKSSVENALSSDGLDLKLGLDKELEENVWLAPGYLVMISAPDANVDSDALTVKDGELMTADGKVYTDHNYIVLGLAHLLFTRMTTSTRPFSGTIASATWRYHWRFPIACPCTQCPSPFNHTPDSAPYGSVSPFKCACTGAVTVTLLPGSKPETVCDRDAPNGALALNIL